jgi:hypothetical protein
LLFGFKPACVGQGLKDPCFFGSFLEEQNRKEKFILWGRKKKNLFYEGEIGFI